LRHTAYATGRYTKQSGNWNNPSTWFDENVPVVGDTVTIMAGHTVTFNQNATIGDDVEADALVIYGTVTWSTTSGSSLTVRGNIQIMGGGVLKMGTPQNPYPPAPAPQLCLTPSTRAALTA